MKTIEKVYTSNRSTWVGDGFPTNSMLPMEEMGNATSPLLVMGYTESHPFSPATHQRGVGMHPHRGFETVTIVFEGELEHQDSRGNSGKIGKNEVQWMTAGRGILHAEHHSKDFAQRGGNLDMIQLWVNLPSHAKMTEPRYQELTEASIPEIELTDGHGSVRVISGNYIHASRTVKGPARTFSPINLLDVKLNAGKSEMFHFDPAWNSIIFVLSGQVKIDGQNFHHLQTVYLTHEVDVISIECTEDARLLIMSGEPLNEPIAAHGPFVMNTEAEIQQAFTDFQKGLFA
ncbi:pirin family protein [Acinetobacter chinensis]|uniref:Pirin family protein n=1 Tax=Acinetobacter chinensis TaxID=2004650 RepID=A0ABU3WDS1_9GAMM|nr:pirin family protein [Acinetobacter chinensis]MDV2468559.1 pirin family protein [Acinetobacter chinensis]